MNPEQLAQGKRLSKAGAWLQFGPLIGVAGTVVAIIRAFDVLREAGIQDPRVLSAKVADALLYAWIGLTVGLVGLLLIATALFVSRYRAVWIFWLLVFYAVVFLTSFPIGSMIGLAIFYYCLTHRAEFLRRILAPNIQPMCPKSCDALQSPGTIPMLSPAEITSLLPKLCVRFGFACHRATASAFAESVPPKSTRSLTPCSPRKGFPEHR